jgi:predicted neuraminidase
VIVGANDSATEEHQHAIEGDMAVKTSGGMTDRLLGCMVEAPLVGREMGSWLCTGIARRRKQTIAAICRGGGRTAGA